MKKSIALSAGCVLSLCVLLALTLLDTSNAAQGSEYELRLRNLNLQEKRVAGVEITLTNASVKAIRGLPQGWSFDIDNDPSGKASLSGGIHVGAAALDGKELEARLRIVAEKCDPKQEIELSIKLSVTTDFSASEELSLTHDKFVLKPL